MEKIVVVIMGQNCEKFIKMCIESVKDADAIVYCDGGSTDKTKEIICTFPYDKQFKTNDGVIHKGISLIENKYNQDDPQMNGKQRNFYLNWIKEVFPNDWCLVLDADEVVEDLSKIKAFIQEAVPGLYSVKMRHFHNDLGHEDATKPIHFVGNRLFKISETKEYPLGEHVILQPYNPQNQFLFQATTIWHLAHINHCFNIKGRYEKNLKHSNIHDKQFLQQWYLAHLFGKYPSTEVNPLEIPDVILNEFKIDRDYFYFANRGLQNNHWIDVIQYKEFLKNNGME